MAKISQIRVDGILYDLPSGGGGGGTNLDEESLSMSISGNVITEVYDSGTKTTTFNNDGSITESWPDGVVMRTVFNADGTVTRTPVTA